jgi:hypothetical protein
MTDPLRFYRAEVVDQMLEYCPVHGSEVQVPLRMALAAPELLEACKRLLVFNEQLCQDTGVSTHYPSADFARAIIAKAEGRGP